MENDKSGIVFDIVLQAVMIIGTISFFLFMHDIPKKLLTKFKNRDRSTYQARRHFVTGAQLLSKARSVNSKPLAKKAAEEADKAIALDPKDAAAHILKALALELQGFRPSALDSLDAALSPLALKSLSDGEKGDALFKRAELKIGMSRVEKVDSAIEDLVDAVKLSQEKQGEAYCLLGECYEIKEMKEEARKAYEEAIVVKPEMKSAQEALDRLGS